MSSSAGASARARRSAASMTDAELGAIVAGVGCLDPAGPVERLSGGLTNVIVKVRARDGRAAVARIGTDDSALLAIDRDVEHAASLDAATGGVAPAVICRDQRAEVLVVAWVEGRTLSDADLRGEAMLARVAELCRRLHAGPALPADFDMFAVQARYLGIVQERGFPLPAGYLDLMPAFDRVRAALAATPAQRRPCHNDLLAENFIDAGDRLWMVDFEYAGNNEAAFELGNIASEANLPSDALGELVRLYHGADDAGQVTTQVARARLLGTASKYGWTLWGCIQAQASSLDFDFWSWGLEKYDRAVQEFAAADFDALLEEVAA